MTNAMNFTKETWLFINTFADWFSAVGTIAAVITSLYLARAQERVKLRLYSGHRLLLATGRPDLRSEYVLVSVTNLGHRAVTITGIGWKSGIFRKKYGVQTTSSDGLSSTIPIQIADGHEAKWFIPLRKEVGWLSDFCQHFLLPSWRIRLFSLRVQVFTSIGRTFDVRVERGLRKIMAQECRRLLQSKEKA
jgi:hypothetical protein